MKKAVSVCLMAVLLFLISCNGSTPEVSSSAAAPVPVFLSGMNAQARSAASDGQPQDDLFLMYKYMIGGFALVGFNGTTSSSEISDVDVLGTPVDFTWTEEHGVFTYDGKGSNMAIKITYDTNAGLIDLIQVSKGSAYENDYYFIVFKADGIEYNNAEKTIDGDYTSYSAMASIPDGEYSLNVIGRGYAHSDENATGVLTTKMYRLGTMNGDVEDPIPFEENPAADIETGNNLITMMEGCWSEFSEEKKKEMTQIDLRVLYSKGNCFFQYPPVDDSVVIDSPEQITEYIKKSVSEKWIVNPDDLPDPPDNENAN